jgi:hypothetical protein
MSTRNPAAAGFLVWCSLLNERIDAALRLKLKDQPIE